MTLTVSEPHIMIFSHLTARAKSTSALALLALTTLASLTTGCTADLRSERLSDHGPRQADLTRGRALLDTTADRHGQSAWRAHSTTEVVMRDDWDSLMADMMGMTPWGKEDLIRIRLRNGSFNVRADFIEGPRAGEAQGVQAWRTWTQMAGQTRPVFESDDDIRFMLPAQIYLFELPFRLTSAPVAIYEGEDTLGDQAVEKVFVTWGEVSPHTEADQYILWINKKTGLIDAVDYTVREAGRFFQSRALYHGYHEVGGVQVPSVMTITSVGEASPDGYIHQVQIDSVAYDSFPESVLYPDQSLAYVGDAKP